MPELLQMCLLVCPLVFLAGFVDSVAGGGGLISLPAYLFVGLPPHIASGTNKVVNSMGTALATWKYYKSGKIRVGLAALAAVGALLGSAIGTRIALYLNDAVFQMLLLVALPIAAVIITVKKDFGQDSEDTPHKNSRRDKIACLLIGIVMGCYDGMIGPGTGTFMIMAFTAIVGMDLLTASGCAKMGNLASNVASAVVWLLNGQVMLSLVIPCAACNMLGSWLGSRYAIRGGSKKVRSMIYVVLVLLFVKFFYELFLAA
ncbi:MAG: sulfite exporter TauE/SafE family protein [Oscillospiraceae bacterium]|nr:sulfite exporter TauE/SafE family protein [Oscillospiraceae bacterium]